MLLIGISGPSASGKSRLAKKIASKFNSKEVLYLPLDDSYYKDLSHLRFDIRDKENFDHPNSFDTTLLYSHLQAAKSGEPFYLPLYNHVTHTIIGHREIKNYKVIIAEGIQLFAKEEILKLLDISIYLDTPLDICLSRRIECDVNQKNRTVEIVLKRNEEHVHPMYKKFIEPTKNEALFIVNGGKNTDDFVALIQAKIHQYLGAECIPKVVLKNYEIALQLMNDYKNVLTSDLYNSITQENFKIAKYLLDQFGNNCPTNDQFSPIDYNYLHDYYVLDDIGFVYGN